MMIMIIIAVPNERILQQSVAAGTAIPADAMATVTVKAYHFVSLKTGYSSQR
jgi:hypothetical protein